MVRIIYDIEQKHAGYRVEQFLHRKMYPDQILKTFKQDPEMVLRNGKPVRMKECLKEGDQLIIQWKEKEKDAWVFAYETDLEILYEDRDILVVNKPAGMSIHISKENCKYTLQNAVTGYFEKKGEQVRFRCMNRLDTDTSGLTLIAKHAISAAILYRMGKRHEVNREYFCIVEGIPPQMEGIIREPIGREEGKLLKMKVDAEGKMAVTHYQVLKTDGHFSFLHVWLDTGRTHQIRVHMKYLGCPIIGDYLYHPVFDLINRQALHAGKLSFLHPITGENMVFETVLPDDFQRVESIVYGETII